MATYAAFVAAILSFAAAMITIVWNRWVQLDAARRQLVQTETTARATAYAQITRLKKTTSGYLSFIQGNDRMIWLTVFRSLFPSDSSLARIAPLTAREVRAISSLLYSYQESIAFITASAKEVVARARAKGATCSSEPLSEPHFKLESDVIEFVYEDDGIPNAERLASLHFRLSVIDRQCDKALEEIRAATLRFYPDSDLAQLIRDESARTLSMSGADVNYGQSASAEVIGNSEKSEAPIDNLPSRSTPSQTVSVPLIMATLGFLVSFWLPGHVSPASGFVGGLVFGFLIIASMSLTAMSTPTASGTARYG